MRQILTYISPTKDFNEEHKMAVKIQIENSLELGWKPEDIILATNFPYEFKGVKSVVIEDYNYCKCHWPATKIYVIVRLFQLGLIENGTYWYHDFDCFQLNPMDNPIEGYDMGITNYGRMPRLCSASMFFNRNARDIFERLKVWVERNKRDEEKGIANLINSDKELAKRVKHINGTYAFQKWNLWHSYLRADKPIKAVHFHLTSDKYDFFIKGNNQVKLKIIPERLVKIFNKYGFK